MFAHGHHSMMGSEDDPKDGGKVATAVFGAVAVYGVSSCRPGEKVVGVRWMLTERQVFLLFCGSQAFLHQRQRAGGEIALQ